MSQLHIVATPIGNLEDITLRALKILKEVDLVLCEDTRVTGRLLSHFNITTPLLSYHQHSRLKKIAYILDELKKGKNIALVSDRGTPGLSDPGGKLIQIITQQFQDLKVIPIPGPSALTVAVSVAGFPLDRFLFLGFLPRKKGRQKFLKEIAQSKRTVIFYESPYRIRRTLLELTSLVGEREICVLRELTKKYETIYRGRISDVLPQIREKGEFVVVIKGKN